MASDFRSSVLTGNSLLDGLTPADRQRLTPYLQPASHPLEEVLYEARGPIEHVYFPTGAVTSAVTVMTNGSAIEVATVGKEGMLGHNTANGIRVSINRVFVQIAGESLRMKAQVFQDVVSGSPELRDLINRYNEAFMAQASQSVACNGLH